MINLEIEQTDLGFTRIRIKTKEYELYVEMRNPLNPLQVALMLDNLSDKIKRKERIKNENQNRTSL